MEASKDRRTSLKKKRNENISHRTDFLAIPQATRSNTRGEAAHAEPTASRSLSELLPSMACMVRCHWSTGFLAPKPTIGTNCHLRRAATGNTKLALAGCPRKKYNNKVSSWPGTVFHYPHIVQGGCHTPLPFPWQPHYKPHTSSREL